MDILISAGPFAKANEAPLYLEAGWLELNEKGAPCRCWFAVGLASQPASSSVGRRRLLLLSLRLSEAHSLIHSFTHSVIQPSVICHSHASASVFSARLPFILTTPFTKTQESYNYLGIASIYLYLHMFSNLI